MKYTVVWTAPAKNDLAELWLQASERSSVATAADTIDSDLSRDPWSQGESRGGKARVMFHAPLGVLFKIDDLDRRVTVAGVWRIRRS